MNYFEYSIPQTLCAKCTSRAHSWKIINCPAEILISTLKGIFPFALFFKNNYKVYLFIRNCICDSKKTLKYPISLFRVKIQTVVRNKEFDSKEIGDGKISRYRHATIHPLLFKTRTTAICASWYL